MRVVHQLDFIVAGFQHVAACAERVERSHVLGGERNRHNLGFTRLQQLCLTETRQNDVRLFNAALGVRRGVVDLHHVLARDAAGVGDLYLHGNRLARAGKGFDALFKRGIAEAVAERVLHGRIVVDVSVRRCGFVVAIAHIDAFRILHVVAIEVAVGEAARVPIGGRRSQIVRIRVDEPAGRVDRTAQHIADRVKADRAGAADPKHRVNAVLNEAELHRVGGVDQHDCLCVALRFDERDQVFLVLRQFEVVPSVVRRGVARRVHILRKIAALAADAGQDDDRRVGIVLCLLQHRVGVSGRRSLGRREVRTGVAALLRTGHAGIFVEVHKLLIDGKARVLQSLDHVHVCGGVAGTAARSAVDRIDRAVAEQVDLCARFQRQRAVFVLQKNDAFVFKFFRHFQALFGRVRNGQDLCAVGRFAAGQHRVQVHAHPGCDHGLERCAGDIDRKRDDKQNGDCSDASFAAAFLVHG